MSHTSFTTTTRGLNRELHAMRLYGKAKRLEKARCASLAEINRIARETEEG